MINKINNPSEEKRTGEENISEGLRPTRNAGRCITQASKSNHNKLSKQTKKYKCCPANFKNSSRGAAR